MKLPETLDSRLAEATGLEAAWVHTIANSSESANGVTIPYCRGLNRPVFRDIATYLQENEPDVLVSLANRAERFAESIFPLDPDREANLEHFAQKYDLYNQIVLKPISCGEFLTMQMKRALELNEAAQSATDPNITEEQAVLLLEDTHNSRYISLLPYAVRGCKLIPQLDGAYAISDEFRKPEERYMKILEDNLLAFTP